MIYQLQGLNGRWKSMRTEWEEYTNKGLKWRNLEDKQKVPLFYYEEDDDDTKRKTGGVLFEFPWRRRSLADCDDDELAEFVRTSEHEPNLTIDDSASETCIKLLWRFSRCTSWH